MKKLLFAALALAGFAACSADSELNEPVAPVKEGAFTIFATQNDFDDTRVTIELDGSDRRTSLQWEATDKIKLTAEKNTAVFNLEMSIPEGGIGSDGKSATFQAASSILPVAEDSYYACYHPTNNANITLNEGKYGLHYTVPAVQSGLPRDAVVLFATGQEAEGEGGIPMQFSAVNSILFVKINNAPTNGFSQLVLTDFNGKYVCGSIYHYGPGDVNLDEVQGNSITIEGTEKNGYLTNALYIMMPGNLDLETGYVLTYTTNDGETMSFGYNAAEPFAPGTIYDVEVNWSLPSVTLGAKTTYSYAAAKNGVKTADPAKANEMGGGAAAGSGTTIFLDSGYASSYSGVQNAMVVDYGFIVDGVTYNKDNGVTRSGKTFYMNNLTGQTKDDHTVQAFIDVKHHGDIVTRHSATETLSVTGIPYFVDFNANREKMLGWTANDGAAWRHTSAVYKLCLYNGYIVSPQFHIPAQTNISVNMNVQYYKVSLSSASSTFTIASTSATNSKGENNKASVSVGKNANTIVHKTAVNGLQSALTNTEPYLCIFGEHDRNFVYDVYIGYR